MWKKGRKGMSYVFVVDAAYSHNTRWHHLVASGACTLSAVCRTRCGVAFTLILRLPVGSARIHPCGLSWIQAAERRGSP
jgi:hypothetical protein